MKFFNLKALVISFIFFVALTFFLVTYKPDAQLESAYPPLFALRLLLLFILASVFYMIINGFLRNCEKINGNKSLFSLFLRYLLVLFCFFFVQYVFLPGADVLYHWDSPANFRAIYFGIFNSIWPLFYIVFECAKTYLKKKNIT